MKSVSLPALILSLGIALSGFFIAYAVIDSRQHTRSVQVKGLSERLVKSNVAQWNLSFNLMNDDLGQLYEAINKSQQKVRMFLINQGFNSDEISINPVTVLDNQNVTYNTGQSPIRFSATAGVSLNTYKVDKVLVSIQKTSDLVQSGIVVTSSNATYRFTRLNDIKPAMLDEATSKAKVAAMSFAKNAESSLGSIKRARQGIFIISDANTNYDSGTSVMKKVRIVTTVDYYLE